ncbi:unnamed protein product [Schistosoma curassoni]|uniref:Cornichon family AMPA receptor auxiliary protein 2 n=1 Tax=Schistosoma curassoni TaxID=6186 RepID=A0A183KSE9_9TREM|nr:unnamed protein product [Schistosoma curassoni]
MLLMYFATFCNLFLTFILIYFSWLMSSMAQVNPLFGPILHRDTIRILQREWEVSFALQVISFLAN